MFARSKILWLQNVIYILHSSYESYATVAPRLGDCPDHIFSLVLLTLGGT